MHYLRTSLLALAASTALVSSSSLFERRDLKKYLALADDIDKFFDDTENQESSTLCNTFDITEYDDNLKLVVAKESAPQACKEYFEKINLPWQKERLEFAKRHGRNYTEQEKIALFSPIDSCNLHTNKEGNELWKQCRQSSPDCNPIDHDFTLSNQYWDKVAKFHFDACPAIVEAFIELWEEGFIITVTPSIIHEMVETRTVNGQVTTVTGYVGTTMTITQGAKTMPADDKFLDFTTAFEAQKSPKETGTPAEGQDKGNKEGKKDEEKGADEPESAAKSIKSGMMGVTVAFLAGIAVARLL